MPNKEEAKRKLMELFGETLRAIDPVARVLVMEVKPSWNPLDRDKSDPVKLTRRQIDDLNKLIGPYHKVVRVDATDEG